MKLDYTKKNILNGALIFCIGDTVASLILNEFSLIRLFGISIIGGTIYAFEVPNVFNWIEINTASKSDFNKKILKCIYAVLYFNPLWIARHLFFINVLNLQWNEITWDLISIGLNSFLWNLPLGLTANYIIQNKIKLKWRFIASSTYSAIMAIYYALSNYFFK